MKPKITSICIWKITKMLSCSLKVLIIKHRTWIPFHSKALKLKIVWFQIVYTYNFHSMWWEISSLHSINKMTY